MWRFMGFGLHGWPNASDPNFSKEEYSLNDIGFTTFTLSLAEEMKFPLTFNTCTFLGTK